MKKKFHNIYRDIMDVWGGVDFVLRCDRPNPCGCILLETRAPLEGEGGKPPLVMHFLLQTP